MSLFVASLNSGSNGNCYYVGNDQEAVLIDGGISCRETEKRIKRLGLSIKKVKAIFVSHEHGDHIHGVPALSKKYRLPVYITQHTYQEGKIALEDELVLPFAAFQPVRVGGIEIKAFPKIHDACDPHSFIIECSGVRVGVFTDIGWPCRNVVRHFRECHAAFLESNYDEQLLEDGRYPIYLKNRIRGGRGHISNTQALELFLKHKPSYMSHLFLSHLSRENNSPELVARLFRKNAGKTEIIIASRERETPLYYIGKRTPRTRISMSDRTQLQLSLF